MKGRKVLALAAAAAVLLGARLPAAEASPTFREDFERGAGEKAADVAVQKPDLKGWRAQFGGDVEEEQKEYLQYPAEGRISPEQGTVEFEVVRGESRDGPLECYFSLNDGDGNNVVSARILWKDTRPQKEPTPRLEVISYGDKSPWYQVVKHPRRPKQTLNSSSLHLAGVGGRFHVAFTWGKEPDDFNLYLDGKTLKTRIDEEQAALFREAIGKAKWIIVGAEVFGGRSWSQSHSVIKSVHIYDQVIDGADLHKNPEKYRTPAPAVAVASVAHDAARVAGFSGKLVAGNTLAVTLEGTPGATGTFDVAHYPDLDRKIALDWRGWGVYLEEKVFFDRGEVDLRAVEGYRVYAAKEPIDIAALSLAPVEGAPPPPQPVETLDDVKEQRYVLENLDIDTPYYVAVVAEMRDGTLRPVIAPVANLPLTESAPGVYTGSYRVGYQDRRPRAVVVGRLASGGMAVSLAGDAASVFAVDPSLTVAVTTEPSVLKADEKSTATVTVTVTDANGNAVADHDIRFLLATTSQYTGVVGGGAFTEQVGGALKADLRGRTDLFGRVTATYVAGFAAKTAVIVARDMASNSTGAGQVRTYIQGTAQLELEPVQQMMAMAVGYEITVTSSDEWLTADGKSQARITARVTRGGDPVEGHRVAFQVASGSGQIRTVSETTGRNGEARAVYTAGKKIGVALITATDTTAGVSGSVQIELRSDAPAKIAITVDPEKLPADGRSRADVAVLVTDVNDNPNDNVEVEYAITEGGGQLKDDKGLTDRNGKSGNTYTAGRSPGRVSIEITVRSREASAEEVVKARDLAVAVPDSRFF